MANDTNGATSAAKVSMRMISRNIHTIKMRRTRHDARPVSQATRPD
jgi:hypothetical protein